MIDLHTHSSRSDGTDTPAELVTKAAALGITTLALTDHDTTAGWSEATASLPSGLDLVLGAEISTLTREGISVHMLGLLFDGTHPGMQMMLEESRDQRLPRMRKMIELMQADGFDITIEDVMARLSDGTTLGRPHLADALVSKRIVATRDEAFKDLLHNDSKYYVTHIAPTPEDAIAMIKRAGGVSIIAHAFASKRGEIIDIDYFQRLKSAGLDAVEVDHRDHSVEERFELAPIAVELDLIITGSSDYHGSGKLNHLAENVTAPEQWERLESRASTRRVVRR